MLPSSLRPLVGRDLTHAYAEHTVLDGIDLTASPGQRVGLIGENGSGKSTLLRLLAGVEQPDAGSVDAPDDLVYLPQEPRFAAGTTIGAVLDRALAPLHRAVGDIEQLGAMLSDRPDLGTEYANRLEWAQHHQAWDADRRAEVAADRLGLRAFDRGRDIVRLSGGQRSRVALAALITRRPSAALLDEPTNHLDDDALGLLEEFLLDLPGVVVAASHDRVFLDRVCTHVVDLDPSHFGVDGEGGRRFGGGYTAFLQAQRQARHRWEQAYEQEQQQLADLRRRARDVAPQVATGRPIKDGNKMAYDGHGERVLRQVSRRVKAAHLRLDRAERQPVRKPPRPLSFDEALTGSAYGATAICVRDLVVTGRVELARLDVPAGGRLLVSGANGSGKSSLLGVLAGRLPADRGKVEVVARRVGLLVQDVSFSNPTRSARRTYDLALGADRASRTPLHGLGLLAPRDANKSVADLSVGQLRRLALAILVARRPDLLLLDEPTNHISLTLADELEAALGCAAGTVVVASHDRWLRRRWEHGRLELDP